MARRKRVRRVCVSRLGAFGELPIESEGNEERESGGRGRWMRKGLDRMSLSCIGIMLEESSDGKKMSELLILLGRVSEESHGVECNWSTVDATTTANL